jgi:hypothetical protein
VLPPGPLNVAELNGQRANRFNGCRRNVAEIDHRTPPRKTEAGSQRIRAAREEGTVMAVQGCTTPTELARGRIAAPRRQERGVGTNKAQTLGGFDGSTFHYRKALLTGHG